MKTYICPGCLYLQNNQIVIVKNNSQYIECKKCKLELINTLDSKKKFLYKIFSFYNKSGFKCKKCKRFLPKPLQGNNIICPYFDCDFCGIIDELQKSHHPKQEIQENIEVKFNNSSIIENIINSQSSLLQYNSHNFTIKHKSLVYQAFMNLSKTFPEEMFQYLIENSRSGGFQAKLFQEYINILEASLPFAYKKKNKIITITSLLDENLNIFDGISEFESCINDKLKINNATKEFYIGGRTGFYSQPYYIGKLLNIWNKETEESILNKVEKYTFSFIKIKDIKPGTIVKVSHLRVIPHYQIGSMVYINRIKKAISEECKLQKK